MSEDTNTNTGTGKGNTKLIIRIVVFLVLAVVVALAVMDYRAKSAATETANAWLGLVGEGDGLFEYQLDNHVVGSPEVEKGDEGYDMTLAYRWSGIIRDYRVDVVLRGKNENNQRHVLSVNGPNNE